MSADFSDIDIFTLYKTLTGADMIAPSSGDELARIVSDLQALNEMHAALLRDLRACIGNPQKKAMTASMTGKPPSCGAKPINTSGSPLELIKKKASEGIGMDEADFQPVILMYANCAPAAAGGRIAALYIKKWLEANGWTAAPGDSQWEKALSNALYSLSGARGLTKDFDKKDCPLNHLKERGHDYTLNKGCDLYARFKAAWPDWL